MQPNPSARRDSPLVTDPVEQELKDFSYMVSHDLAASLRHLSAFSRLLLNDLNNELTARQQRYADRIEVASDRCQAMMEQLLAFSRAQQAPLACVPHDATTLMRMALLQLSEEVATSRAEITIGQLGEIYADPDLLLVVFRHLLDNAIKFHRPEVPPRVDVSAASRRGVWTLRVSDNGQGVAPEYREKAFQMFQRLHPEGAYPGVGVGLSLCRRIARRHGGDVRFVDQKVGACVEVTLPHNKDIH